MIVLIQLKDDVLGMLIISYQIFFIKCKNKFIIVLIQMHYLNLKRLCSSKVYLYFHLDIMDVLQFDLLLWNAVWHKAFHIL